MLSSDVLFIDYAREWLKTYKKVQERGTQIMYENIIVFRHNYCANLCYQMSAISIKRIARLLGDTEKMVLEVYNHVLEEKANVQEVVGKAIAL